MKLLIGPFKFLQLGKPRMCFFPQNEEKILLDIYDSTYARLKEKNSHSSMWHSWTSSMHVAPWVKTEHSVVGLLLSTHLSTTEQNGMRWSMQYKSIRDVQSSQLLLSFKECKFMHLNDETGGNRGYSTWYTKSSFLSALWASPSFLSS